MTPITDFRKEIILEVPKVTNEATDLAIISVIQDICERTLCYKVNLDDLYIIKGITDYEIASAESNTAIVLITGITRDGYPFNSYSYDLITFRLNEQPTDDFILKIQAAIKPARTASTVHDTFINNYYEHILAGAKAKLMLQLSKPWSNPTLGAKYQSDYEMKITQIKIDMQKQYSASNNLKVQIRGFI